MTDNGKLTLGVTGPSGSGKSLICSLLGSMGFTILDCDAIYHGLTDVPSDCTRELEAEFGAGILRADGSLDRRALAALVFAPGAEPRLERLNTITHKYVLTEVRRRIADGDEGSRGYVIDAPLLFQAGFDRECGSTVAVLAPEKLRVGRLMRRDGISEEAVRARLAAAEDDGWYFARADRVIWNDGGTDSLRKRVARLVRELEA